MGIIKTNQLLIPILLLIVQYSMAQATITPNTIHKNGMTVFWKYEGNRVFFEMSAPTNGWVTIGFNEQNTTTRAYLLMGNIVNEKVNLVEHYTLSAGNYKPITKLNSKVSVKDISGIQSKNESIISFSLPTKAANKYARDLNEGTEYFLIMAYSQSDDFQHHSIMRASVNIKL